jgi:hypothetical protein
MFHGYTVDFSYVRECVHLSVIINVIVLINFLWTNAPHGNGEICSFPYALEGADCDKTCAFVTGKHHF